MIKVLWLFIDQFPFFALVKIFLELFTIWEGIEIFLKILLRPLRRIKLVTGNGSSLILPNWIGFGISFVRDSSEIGISSVMKVIFVLHLLYLDGQLFLLISYFYCSVVFLFYNSLRALWSKSAIFTIKVFSLLFFL